MFEEVGFKYMQSSESQFIIIFLRKLRKKHFIDWLFAWLCFVRPIYFMFLIYLVNLNTHPSNRPTFYFVDELTLE